MQLDRVKFIGLRVAKGLSQDALAKRLGISRPTLDGWEKGHTSPKLGQINAAAEEFGVEPEELVTRA